MKTYTHSHTHTKTHLFFLFRITKVSRSANHEVNIQYVKYKVASVQPHYHVAYMCFLKLYFYRWSILPGSDIVKCIIETLICTLEQRYAND